MNTLGLGQIPSGFQFWFINQVFRVCAEFGGVKMPHGTEF